jgi:hypothetical protein
MSKLKQIIREIVESELDEMARISTNIKIGDAEKASVAKELYAGTWYGDLIDYVEEAGETGIPQPELAKMLGKSGMQAINPKVREFVEAGILTKGDLSVAKKEKPESTGVQGRPTSEKTLMAKAINDKMEKNADYEPSEEEVALLGKEFIDKLRMRVKGLLKRGRKPGASTKVSSDLMAAMKSDDSEEEIVDDEEIEDVNEVKPPTSVINESFLHMQKLAGLK